MYHLKKKKRLWFIYILWFPCIYHGTYAGHCSMCSVSFLNFKHCSHGCVTCLFYYTSHSWVAGVFKCVFNLPRTCSQQKGKKKVVFECSSSLINKQIEFGKITVCNLRKQDRDRPLSLL